MTCKPYIFVHDDEYYDYCARCRWVSDTATNITVARVRADRHQQEGENERPRPCCVPPHQHPTNG